MQVPKIITKDTVMWFGKHQGQTVGQLLEEDPAYLSWCRDSIEGFAEAMGEELDDEVEESAADAEGRYGMRWEDFQ